jgi:hypothetical protein
MRLVIRNKSKLISAFGEGYYNTLIDSIKNFTYEPDKTFWNEALKMEMVEIPSSTNQSVSYTFAIVSEKWDVIILAFYSENKPSK